MRDTIRLFGAIFIATLLTASRLPAWGDAQLSCTAATAWITDGRPSIDAIRRSDVVPSPDGHRYSKYGLLPTLACMPAAWMTVHAPGAAAALVEASIPAATGALCAVFLYLVALRLRLRPGDAALLSALLYFGSPLWVYARFYYGEAQQAALLCALVLASLWARDEAGRARRRLVVGLVLGMALLAKPSFLLFAPLAAIDTWLSSHAKRRRGSELAWLSLGLLPGLLLFAAYNDLRYGSPIAMGYGAERDGTLGFSVPLFAGAYGLLLSSGKSVFLYCPLTLIALLHLRRAYARSPSFTVASLTLSALIFVTAAKWWAWSGDWAWGPRLLLPALPLFGLLAADGVATSDRRRRWLTLAAGGSGIAVNLLGVVIHYRSYLGLLAPLRKIFHALAPATRLRDDLVAAHFVPELSPIVGHAWLVRSYFTGESLASKFPWQSLGLPGADLPSSPMDSLDLAFADGRVAALAVLAAAATIVIVGVRGVDRR